MSQGNKIGQSDKPAWPARGIKPAVRWMYSRPAFALRQKNWRQHWRNVFRAL